MKKFFLILGLGLIAFIIILVVLFMANKDKMLGFALEKSMPQIETMLVDNLPEGISKQDVHENIAKAVEKIKSHQVDPKQLEKLMLEFKDAVEDKNITAKEAEDLFSAIKKLAE